MAQPLVLTNTRNICLLDEEDYLRIKGLLWYEWKLPKQNTSYVRKKIDGTQILLHRLIMACPDHLIVDHINGDGLDNRKENLRIVTKSQNNYNSASSPNNTSKYKGVYWKADRSKWGARARCILTKSSVHIGYYNTEQEAALAYNRYCRINNPFAKLNLIKE